MNLEGLHNAVRNGRVNWHKHVFERMMERGISRMAVKDALMYGDVIEDYPDDRPCPSALIFGMVNLVPLHVVAAYDEDADLCHVITAYIPDENHFQSDFRTRRE